MEYIWTYMQRIHTVANLWEAPFIFQHTAHWVFCPCCQRRWTQYGSWNFGSFSFSVSGVHWGWQSLGDDSILFSFFFVDYNEPLSRDIDRLFLGRQPNRTAGTTLLQNIFWLHIVKKKDWIISVPNWELLQNQLVSEKLVSASQSRGFWPGVRTSPNGPRDKSERAKKWIKRLRKEETFLFENIHPNHYYF